ncbi:hypothetical protein [Gordonia paraffinivorans]|uniref:hypothetical protein n=1 Tax=Gordonia paraffinivorans TaxID=175628 RepID=UPI00215A6D58|nr:hypothetical protein [Gordonia paraffinivorans]
MSENQNSDLAAALANVRWLAARCDPAASGFVSSVLDEDPVAAAAREELDEATRASIAMAVGNKWTEITERVQVMAAVSAIETAA